MVALVAATGVLIAQAVALGRIYRSLCWWLYSVAYVVLAGLQLWSLIRLPAAILRAQARGEMPDSLTWEQTIRIGMIFLFLALVGLAQDRNRRDLRKLGI